MSSERPRKKVKIAKDAEVSVGEGSYSGIHLTPEIVAHVATFADAVNSSDVMNMCLAVGPVASRTVRHNYLWRNKKYLGHSISRLRRRISHTGQMASEKACSNHLAWMRVNSDWRSIAVRDDLMQMLKLASTVRESDRMQLNHLHPFIAFNNPAVAIQIGLFDSLQYLVEEKGINTNSFQWTAFGFSKIWHLLYYAVTYSKKKIFEYLLNRPDLNIRCNATQGTKVHPLFHKLLSAENQDGNLDDSFLKIFMQQPEFDVNGQIIPSNPSFAP